MRHDRPGSRSRRRSVLPLCALALLAGCADLPLVYNQSVANVYNPTEFGYGAGRRDLTTVIRGDPFDMGQERFADAVIEVLNRHEPRPQPTNFTTTPGESARPAYRVLLLFDAPAAVSRLEVCRGSSAVPQVDPGDEVRVTAAFCRSGGALSSLTAEIGQVEGVDDPAFDRLIGQVVALLFPTTDPTEDDDPIVVSGN